MQAPKKYILLMDDDHPSQVQKVSRDLNVKLTSSAELSSQVKAHQVFEQGDGLFFKNLNVAVVESIEAEKMKSVAEQNSNIIYWEEEKVFSIQDSKSLLQSMKEDLAALSIKLEELEKIIQSETEVDTPKDTKFSWGMGAIGIHESKLTGKGVNIAILDTGFFAAHPDFQNRDLMGKSFIKNESWDKDGNGHGTHCAGVAVGDTSQDGFRYGIANEASIAIGKVLKDNGLGSSSGIIDAIDWALEKQMDIISMSFGLRVKIGEAPSPIFEFIGRKALNQNCLLIAAAGNDSDRPNLPRPVSSPANAESIMAVAALDQQLRVAKFSNGGINASDGGRIDLAAPGVEIFSAHSMNATNPSLYTNMNGTSMSTPHVAGLAALYKEAFPNLSAAELWLKLEKNAKKLTGQKFRDVGNGLAYIL
ncbi:MAG: S8 family serine peptidase [Bacteroidota bacterium]